MTLCAYCHQPIEVALAAGDNRWLHADEDRFVTCTDQDGVEHLATPGSEICSFCNQEFPFPIGHHHAESDCTPPRVLNGDLTLHEVSIVAGQPDPARGVYPILEVRTVDMDNDELLVEHKAIAAHEVKMALLRADSETISQARLHLEKLRHTTMYSNPTAAITNAELHIAGFLGVLGL